VNALANEIVLIGPSSFSAQDQSPLDRLLATGCRVIDNPFKRRLTKLELLDLLSRGVTGLIAGLEPLDREVLTKSNLKVISRCGSGLSNVDLESARELGIKVYSTPCAPVEAVAELTLGAMLCLLRMISQLSRDLHEGKWNKRIGFQLKGKTVVIIGFGRIGQRVASLLAPFEVRILAVDPQHVQAVAGVSVEALDEALPQADIIVIHANGRECILSDREFGLLRKGVFLLNAARGTSVDEAALIHAIERGTVAGAWLDTFSREPYEGPLTRYPQVILTPHVGSYTAECRRQMETEAVENLIAGLSEGGKGFK